MSRTWQVVCAVWIAWAGWRGTMYAHDGNVAGVIWEAWLATAVIVIGTLLVYTRDE